jgi:hypothetical protein
MPAEQLRFIHAANLRLDAPLQDTGPLPDDLQTIIQSATITAWERLVEACLNLDVDFLLLAGDCFDQHDPGLRGQAALVLGCERLNTAGIPVFIVLGQLDPVAAWLPGLRLPENVTRLDQPGVETVDISGDDADLATLHGVNCPTAYHAADWATWLDQQLVATQAASASDTPHILLLPFGLSDNTASDDFTLTRERLLKLIDQRGISAAVRYWAGGHNTDRITLHIGDAVAHCPGSPQGLSPAETGPRGATLVEIDATGAVRLNLIPTAPVRWEHCLIRIDETVTPDDLLLSMRSALRDRVHHASDRLWLIDWTIALPQSTRKQFADEPHEHSLRGQLLANSGIDEVSVWSRRFRWLETNASMETESPPFTPPAPLELHHDRDIPLLGEYHRIVAATVRQPHWLPLRLEESPLHDGPWGPRVARLVSELNAADIAADVRQLGDDLFPTASVTGSSR